jgi:translation initiation factor IF-2
MRVYELAKKIGVSSKDLMALLEKEKIKVSGHMALLSDEDVLRVEKLVSKKDTESASHTKQKEVRSMQGEQQSRAPKKTGKVVRTVKTNHKSTQSKERAPEKRVHATASLKQQKPAHIEPSEPIAIAPKELVLEPMLVSEFAEKMDLPTSEVILTLLRWGIMSAKSQRLEKDLISRLAAHYGATLVEPQKIVSDSALQQHAAYDIREHALVSRLPVVVVLGHVDHGKTSLLDYIRKTRIAEKEKGGITQHIGAYEATTPQGNVIFIDTPGHEAFSKIRQRGSRVADIAILVIAADDGIMPQTLEAIKHIKNAQIPVVVAVNKIDKVDISRLDVIKRQLAQHDLLPEDWGGQVVVAPISAKTGKGIDHLLEMVLLQTQLLDLKAEENTPYKGYILESKMEKGRGAVATVLGKHGTLKIGDYFACGDTTGKITSIVNSRGETLQSVGPSVPVQVSGFEGQAQVGDFFRALSKDEWRVAKAAPTSALSQTAQAIAAGAHQYQDEKDAILLLVKTDTNSSREALVESIEKVARKAPVRISIIGSSIGYVTESDVELAYTTGARIICLHTKVETKALVLAQQRGVAIQQFDIIYKLLEYLEQFAESKRAQEFTTQKIGEALVLKVFDIKGVGVIAGCRVTEGKCTKDSSVVVWRGRYKVGEGKITSLQREKRAVKEVLNGFECGISVENFADFAPDDRLEISISVPVAPK